MTCLAVWFYSRSYWVKIDMAHLQCLSNHHKNDRGLSASTILALYSQLYRRLESYLAAANSGLKWFRSTAPPFLEFFELIMVIAILALR